MVENLSSSIAATCFFKLNLFDSLSLSIGHGPGLYLFAGRPLVLNSRYLGMALKVVAYDLIVRRWAEIMTLAQEKSKVRT